MKYSDWTVISEPFKSKQKTTVTCKCKCGKTQDIAVTALEHGKSKSCRSCAFIKMHKRNREGLFWSHVDILSDNDCWNWELTVNDGGYGQTTKAEFGTSAAHRIAWQYTNGKLDSPIFVLHKCDNPKCCNPKHLYLGTHRDNMDDMVNRNRRKGKGCGAANGRAKLTQEQAEEIREHYKKCKISQEKIAGWYGISQRAVSAIIRNERYI